MVGTSLRRLCILALLAALGPGPSAHGQVGLAAASHLVPISELFGMDPEAVRARLADVPATWPIRPQLVLRTSTGVLTFVALYNLFQAPELSTATARAKAGNPGFPGHLDCAEYDSIGGRAPDLAHLDVLMFRDGRLEAAFAYTDSNPTTPMPSPSAPWAHWEAFYDRPQPTPYIARSGDLLLADGAGFLARWDKVRMAPADRLGVGCIAKPAAAVTIAHPGSLNGFFDNPAAVLIPLAVTLPFKNHERLVAGERGGALLAALRPGAALGEPVARFAEDHLGVQMFTGSDPAYVVLKIDMGAPPSRHVDNTDVHALVGIRDDQVEWIAPAGDLGSGLIAS